MNANQDLAKRAVACKGFRWMPGMRIFGGATVVDEQDDRIGIVVEGQSCIRVAKVSDVTPDMQHPATRGCLLELVRAAWGDCTVWGMVDPDSEDGEWLCTGLECGQIGTGATESEALIAALEAAPRRYSDSTCCDGQIVCATCNGDGILDKPELCAFVDCPDCDGMGSRPCPDCGKGKR